MENQDNPAVEPTLLIVDDDRPFLQRIGRAMESRGFAVEMAESVAEGLACIAKKPPDYAVVDMRLEDGNGLDVIAVLKEVHPKTRAVVLRVRLETPFSGQFS